MIGVDACKSGWCVVHGQADAIEVSLISQISELEKIKTEKELVFIDIPIGLPDRAHPRNVEQVARKVLPSKSSSFFGVPCREAVCADSYREANVINKSQLGKGLSIQSWHICPKIKEVNIWMRRTDQQNIKEAHPELCFHFLQKEDNLLFSKKTMEGREQRLKILSNWFDGMSEAFDSAMSKYLRKQIAADDILDAMCMWVVAMLSESHGLQTITKTTKDKDGLAMNMHYVDPYGKSITY